MRMSEQRILFRRTKDSRRSVIILSAAFCLTGIVSLTGCVSVNDVGAGSLPDSSGSGTAIEFIFSEAPFFTVRNIDYLQGEGEDSIRLIDISPVQESVAVLMWVALNDESNLQTMDNTTDSEDAGTYMIYIYDANGKRTNKIDLHEIIPYDSTISCMCSNADGTIFLLTSRLDDFNQNQYIVYSLDSSGISSEDPCTREYCSGPDGHRLTGECLYRRVFQCCCLQS